MNMVLRPSNCVEPHSFARLMFEIVMDAILDRFDQNWIVEFCVPRDMQIDFAVYILRHVGW